MMRKISSIAFAATLFGLAGTAHAQGYAVPFGSKGDVAFGAERLFGVHWVKNSLEEPDGRQHSSSGTSAGLGWYFAEGLQFNQPRLGVDFFVVRDISIGGALGFFSRSGRGEGPGGGSEDGFIVSPRVGFNVSLSQSISFWPKVGLTYISVGDDHAFGFSGEGNFVFFPRSSWGFLVTPTVDLAPFGGRDNHNNAPNSDLQSYSFGISTGILGVL
jgi:hypothetical protein